jgi:SAM-dependent methyltransferase
MHEMNIIRRVNGRLKRDILRLTGPKRYCIICNRNFRGKFLPISKFYIENKTRTGFPYEFDDGETLNYKEYNCPYCGSVDRDRLYALFISKNIQKNKIYKLLDIAPSKILKEYLKTYSQIKYRSADLSMEGVDDLVDIMDMKIYPDCSFDIFICSHVLEHVLDDRKAMRELHRILKPDGFAICMVPIILNLKDIDEDITITDPDERWRRFGQDDHVRLYSKQGFIGRLTEAEFKVEQYTVDNFSLKEFILHGISPKSVLYIVKK